MGLKGSRSMQATLRRVGGSTMLAIPPAVLELLDLGPGSRLEISVDDGRLVVEPRKKPKYTLAELLAKCDPNAPISDEDREWANGRTIGDEFI